MIINKPLDRSTQIVAGMKLEVTVLEVLYLRPDGRREKRYCMVPQTTLLFFKRYS